MMITLSLKCLRKKNKLIYKTYAAMFPQNKSAIMIDYSIKPPNDTNHKVLINTMVYKFQYYNL